MNPLGTIRGSVPQGAGKRGFKIFNSVSGIFYFSNRRLPWKNETINENDGCKTFFKNYGRNNVFEFENDGRKNS